MGIGFMSNDFISWMFIGLGAGFLIMLMALLLKARKDKKIK
jgi:hypothetical protein